MILHLLAMTLLAPPQAAVFADPASPESAIGVATTDWAPVAGPTIGDSLASIAVLESPTEDLAISLLVGNDASLSLSVWEGSWGAGEVLTPDLGEASGLVVGGAFESNSGRVLVAYRKGNSALIYFRVYDPESSVALSSEDWFDLGMPGAPSRIILCPKPGSNDVLLVAASGSSLRAATWDGESFLDPSTLETGFDNGPDAIAAEWRKGSAMVLWARSSDTTPRGSEFDGETWTSTIGLPSTSNPIARLELAGSNDRSGAPVLLTLIASDGVNHSMLASTLDDGGWSVATSLSTALRTTASGNAWWETSGTGATGVWQETGETVLRVARWDSGAWSVATSTEDLGGTASRVVVRPAQGLDSGIHTLVSVTSASPALEEYLVYASEGSLDLGTATTIDGLAGAGLGHTLPDPPSVSAGTDPVSIGNNKSVTLAPGSYGTVSLGNRSTLNLSSGEYQFGAFSPGYNKFTLHADTTGGPVVLTLCSGTFDAKNSLTISTEGPGPFEIHLLTGDFIASNLPNITASIIVHAGNIELGNSATASAHLLASGDVTIGNSGDLSSPGWDSPFVDPSPVASDSGSLVAITVEAGTPGSPVVLASGWEHAHPIPFDLGWQRPQAGLRITGWREVPSYDD